MWSIKRQQFCMTIYTYNVFKSLIDFQYFTWNIEGDKYSFVNTNRICGVTLKDFMGFCIQLNIWGSSISKMSKHENWATFGQNQIYWLWYNWDKIKFWIIWGE